MTKLALVGSSQAVGHKNTQNTANTSGHLFPRAHKTCMHLGIFIYCWCLKHPYDDPDYRKTFSYISWLYASAREDPGCLSTVQEWIVIVAISALEGRNVSVMLQCTPTANQSHGHIHSTPPQQISEQLKNNHRVCVCSCCIIEHKLSVHVCSCALKTAMSLILMRYLLYIWDVAPAGFDKCRSNAGPWSVYYAKIPFAKANQ